MRRAITTLAAIFLTLSLAGQASAFSVSGGTVEQQDRIVAAINATQFPSVSWVDAHFIGGVNIEIVEHFEPYWMEPLTLSLGPSALGAAWAGEIRIMAALAADEWLTEVVTHEWSHEVWFALPSAANAEWRGMATVDSPGYDPGVWLQNPAENHAENLRVAAWSEEWWVTAYPRTDLKMFTPAVVRAWHEKWTNPTTTTTTSLPPTTTTTVPPPPPTTTTTIARGDPFPDVARDDTELWEAAWWAKQNSIIFGYSDGQMHPWDALTRRHAALMIARAGGAINVMWVFDYGAPTRGELAKLYPTYQWQEARMDERLLRSQLLRLLWRAR